MTEIVLATSNPNKVEEINNITKPYGITFVLPPSEFAPNETGEDFESNSLIKAIAAFDLTHKPTLADDSGLCVDFLNGEPGIYSARYANTPQERIEKLLNNMKNATNRKAKFVCAMTLLDKEGNVAGIVTGTCNGEIALEPKGNNGFGYDPVFLVDGQDGKTMAELSEEDKNKLSHRFNALEQILEIIKKNPSLL